MDQLLELHELEAVKTDKIFKLSVKKVTMEYNLYSGKYNIVFPNRQDDILSNVFAEVKLGDKIISTAELKRDDSSVKYEEHTDSIGNGLKVSVISHGEGVSLLQSFCFYENCVVIDLSVRGDNISTNYVCPIAAKKPDIKNATDPRFLFVPFDNDDFIRYKSVPLNEAEESYSVTAIFDNASRNGYVIGAITHDTWKTGITVKEDGLKIFGGITSYHTRDKIPHGEVCGQTIDAPKVFVGFYEDWRDGLEAYGKGVGAVSPPLPWKSGVPFGWNSWSAVATKISYDIYTQASDFVKEHLQCNSFKNNQGIVYINFDSFWDNLTVEEKIAAANHVKANGQRPGIYYTPFAYWDTKNPARVVEGTNCKYTYHDIITKDMEGNYIPSFSGGGDGGFPTDPTHPGNKMRVEHQLRQFMDWGFEYVKFDFMSHGSVEGKFYDQSVTTGIQAYNHGMRHILDVFGDRIKNETMFLSLSIAPIFPSQYAHGRRISCDIFGTINWAEYMLNSLTYGWWLNRAVYPYNDPDHICTYNSFNHREEILFNEGLTRYVSSAIAGTFMIDSDDFRLEEAKTRAKAILTNSAINSLASEGVTFRPVEGNTGENACDIFVRNDKDVFYIAAFNFSDNERKDLTINLRRAGLNTAKVYKMIDMVSGEEEGFKGDFLTINLKPAEPKLFKLV